MIRLHDSWADSTSRLHDSWFDSTTNWSTPWIHKSTPRLMSRLHDSTSRLHDSWIDSTSHEFIYNITGEYFTNLVIILKIKIYNLVSFVGFSSVHNIVFPVLFLHVLLENFRFCWITFGIKVLEDVLVISRHNQIIIKQAIPVFLGFCQIDRRIVVELILLAFWHIRDIHNLFSIENS